MRKIHAIFVGLIFVIFAAGCLDNKKEDAVTITEGPLLRTAPDLECKSVCKQNKIYYEDKGTFSSGPCLSNEIKPDWVCDVAHNPRQAVDDLPENQCSAFRDGTAHHFIEVDENCNVIRAV